MPDILLRDLPEHLVSAIDATAARLGLSRNEYLRRELACRFAPNGAVTLADLEEAAEVFADAKDPQIMAGAWKNGR
jgi:hypothetical protein